LSAMVIHATITEAQSKPVGESHFSRVWVFIRAV
jgi:hypothetical protein